MVRHGSKGAAKLLHLRKNKTADLVAGCLYDLKSCLECVIQSNTIT